MDRMLFHEINRLSGRNKEVDQFFVFISRYIKYIFALVLIIMWFQKQPYKKIVYNSAISVVVNVCLTTVVNWFYFKPRPYMLQNVNVLIRSKRNSAFPSKHTLLTFAVAVSTLMYRKTIGFLLLFASCLTGFSRIWTGVHYPLDILSSAFVGSFVSVLVNRILIMMKIQS